MAKQAETSTPESQFSGYSLTDLRPAKGSTKTKLRVGRGRASGAGKTSNRGHNGEGQRSGRSSKRGFEGGQMPGYRQMPKINGFRLINQRQWVELNVSQLAKLAELAQGKITYEFLKAAGLLKTRHDGIRVLGNGELTSKIEIEAHHVTPGAKQKIEAAGGAVHLFE